MSRLRDDYKKETGKEISKEKEFEGGFYKTVSFDKDYTLWLEQRADHDWGFAHESISRIYREVKKALPNWSGSVDDIIEFMIDDDVEIRTEIILLIKTLIEDIENNE